MKKVIRLTEDDLTRIVKQVINESSNEEDVKGKKCESCGKGTYKETEHMDDLRGTLHCSKCDKMVDRYKKYTPFKKKSNKLSESDLVRLVKRVIKEKEDDGKIHIPSQYGGVMMELGKEVSPEEIINSYNEIVDGTPLVSYSEYGTEGMFYNEDNDEIPLDVILDELNYAITGDDDMGGIVVPKSKGMGHKDGNDFYLDDHIKLTKEDGRIIFRFKPNKMAHSGARVISPKQIQELIDFLSE